MRAIASKLLLLSSLLLLTGAPVTRAGQAALFQERSLEWSLYAPHVQRGEALRGLPDVLGPAACVTDANADGWPDLLVLTGGGPTRHYGGGNWWDEQNPDILFLNRQGKGFRAHPLTAPKSDRAAPLNSQTCAVGDLNGDGREDLVIGGRGPIQIWRNKKDGGFELVRQDTGFAETEWATSITLLDFDRDGDLDVFVGRFVRYDQNKRVYEGYAGYVKARGAAFEPTKYDSLPNRLYINRGDWQWRELTGGLEGRKDHARTVATYRLDVDRDGWTDLVEVNVQSQRNRVWRNVEGQRLEVAPDASRRLAHQGVSTVHITALDGDRWPDWVMGTDPTWPLVVGRDLGRGAVRRGAVGGAARAGNATRGLAAGDYDGDGWAEIYAANGHRLPSRYAPAVAQGQDDILVELAANETARQGKRSLARAREAGVLGKSGRDVVRADFDRDGDLDLFVANNNAAGSLWINKGRPSGNWLKILPRDRFGHKGRMRWLKLTTSSRVLRAFGAGIQSSGGRSSPVRHFGLRAGETVESATIKWSDGGTERFKGLERATTYRLRQGAGPKAKTGFGDDARVGDGSLRGWGASNARRRDSLDRMRRARDAIWASAGKPPAAVMRSLRTYGWDASTYWLMGNLRADVQVCRTARQLAHYFDTEALSVRTKRLAVAPMIRAARRAQGEQLRCLVRALGRSQDYRAYRATLNALDSLHVQVRRAAARALGQLGRREARPRLAELARRGPVGVAAEAVLSLREIGSVGAREAVRERVHDMEPRARCALVERLQKINDQRLVISEPIPEWIGLDAAGCDGD